MSYTISVIFINKRTVNGVRFIGGEPCMFTTDLINREVSGRPYYNNISKDILVTDTFE